MFAFFYSEALSYLQTRPQIWSSNFTVLALALEKYEDNRLQSHVDSTERKPVRKKQKQKSWVWIQT